jgi:hypothetical protein
MLFLSLLVPLASAQEATTDAPPKTEFEIGGKYTVWALNQHNFLLGQDAALNDADYVVQMLRFQGAARRANYGVVFRADVAQGWWGVDNSPDVQNTAGTDADGNVTNSTAWNPYKLFGNKDTNYGMHVDQAYAYLQVPLIPFPTEVRVGRQNYKVGHGLVLDQDADGVQLHIQPVESFGLVGYWAKMSEGMGSTRAPTGALMNDDAARADADVFGGSANLNLGAPFKAQLYGLHYRDNSGDGTASYLPNGMGYLNARFRPNLSIVTAVGATADGKLPVADGLRYQVEGAYLFGQDNVDNADYGGGNLDINNGKLYGWTAFVALDQDLTLGIPWTLGATFGMGSGDDDVSGGQGNVNKIMTQGFFPLTNVWEDSVMPDVGGISPQGLGSPVSRGYREFENTLAVQGRVGIKPVPRISLTGSYTYLRAVNPVASFDDTGTYVSTNAQDLGQEIDANLKVQLYPKLTYACLFGVFLPGDAAGHLMIGSATNLEPAWEVKQVLTASF